MNFSGRILMLGFGSIGSASLPVLLDHLTSADKIHIIAKDSPHWSIADSYSVSYEIKEITEANYIDILNDYKLTKGDFVVNLTYEVGCVDLMLYCNQVGALYIDTCIEPWTYNVPVGTANSDVTNYAMRESALAIKDKIKGGATAVVAHGANPGLVNHFTKRALVEIASLLGKNLPEPASQQEWAEYAATLKVKAIQISERDTQIPTVPKKRGEFVNTWSVDGFIAEGVYQPAELGWGTHEKEMPKLSARHTYGCDSAIYINQPGASVGVRGWTPDQNTYHGFLVTHNESISIADYFTQKNDSDNVVYRPTVYYCYHPCDAAVSSIHEILGNNSVEQIEKRVINAEIVSGVDELGVLILGEFGEFTGYWHGSNLSIDQARALVPHNSATSLQVVAGIISAMIWAIENPNEGLVEADEMDYKRVLEIADPYLGSVVSKTTTWTPLVKKNRIVIEDFDESDPFQFKNFLVKF